MLKMAVIGVGALGRHHARILSEQPDVELVAVVDSSEDNGRKVAESCKTAWQSEVGDLPARIDAVSIVVPTQAHLAAATPFLKAGVPVMVEKPIAATLDQARSLAQLADDCQTILQVGHIERFNPVTAPAWEQAGEPRYIKAERVSPYSFRSTDIGAVHDLMIHDLDLILSLVKSPVRAVSAFGVCLMGGHEDMVQARINFKNGCIADVTASRVNPTAHRRMQIWSATACTSVDFHTRELVVWNPSDAMLQGPTVLERAKQPGANIEELKQQVFDKFIRRTEYPIVPADALTAELRHFIDCVRTKTRPVVSGWEGVQAMELADRILQSVAEHQWDGHAEGQIGPHLQTPSRRRMAA